MLKKTFNDSKAAVEALLNFPDEDLMRIIGLQVPPHLSSACAEWLAGATHIDRALFAVCLCNGFHSGYSLAIADLSANPPVNLHVEYVNEQRTSNAGGSNGTIPTSAHR